MLETFFKYPGVLDRMRRGPLAGEIDGIADALACTGYARATTRRYLSLAATFSRYAIQVGCTGPESIDRELIGRFLAEIPVTQGTRSQSQTALGHTLRFLARRYPRKEADTRPKDSHDVLLTAFDAHLRDVRGLQPRSREGVLLLARRMLTWYRDHQPGRPLSEFGAKDVLAFVAHISSRCVADATRSEAVSHVRTLMRFLRWEGVLQEDLARLVPRVPCWPMARVPVYLTWPEVRLAIDAIDTTDAVGKRDRALLLLLATTGLRSQEVRRLELGDVHWRKSEVHVRRTKSRRERTLPLLEEAGSALADYVLNGRPRVKVAPVFLRHVPPVGPLSCSSTLSAIIGRRLARCGIRPKRVGAHLIRHSLATRMVQQERPVKEVADLLGHRHIDTTAVYVKVALPQLAEVALPFPGGEV